MKKILVFSASNSKQSINLQVAAHAGLLLQTHSPSIIGLQNYSAPIYSIDIEKNNGIPQSISELQLLFKEVSGFIIACPEHNGSMPAFFKNIIDWLSRIDKLIFQDKPVFLITTSPGPRGALTVNENLQMLLPRWGAKSVTPITIGNYNNIKFAQEYFEKNQNVFVNFANKLLEFEKLV